MNELERLIRIIKELDLTDKEFSKRIGINPQNITQYKEGIRPISPKVWINTVKAFPQLNYKWVLFGEGEISDEKYLRNTIEEPSVKYVSEFKVLSEENAMLKNELIKCKDEIIQLYRKVLK